MRAICLWQPFASLVASGLKSIETRTWPTDYRGEFVVCATKGAAPKTLYAHTLNRMRALGHPTDGYEYGVAPRGVTLCAASLIDCRPMTLADVPDAFVDPIDLATGKTRWAWVLAPHPRPLHRVPIVGRQAWFQLTPEELPCPQ